MLSRHVDGSDPPSLSMPGVLKEDAQAKPKERAAKAKAKAKRLVKPKQRANPQQAKQTKPAAKPRKFGQFLKNASKSKTGIENVMDVALDGPDSKRSKNTEAACSS